MTKLTIRKFDRPDEVRPYVDKGHVEFLKLEELSIARSIFEPGWRWSTHVRPIAGTATCQVHHYGYVLSGRMHVQMDDGQIGEFGPGDVVDIPPGHDAWVLGDEAVVLLDFSPSVMQYAQPALQQPAAAQKPAVQH